VKNSANDEEFYSKMNAELEKQYKEDFRNLYFFKLSTARARKGITKKTVKILPSRFPKRSYEYEIFEGMLFITNTLINFYGKYEKDKKKFGGKCFKSEFMKTSCEKRIVDDNLWDKSFIPIEEININILDIVGGNTDWQKGIFIPDDTVEKYKEINPEKVEMTEKERFLNPTKWITYQFINDDKTDGMLSTFKIDLLASDITEVFKTDFFKILYENLKENKDYSDFNLISLPNKYLFSSCDYLVLNPPNENILQSHKEVSVLNQYIYKCLVEYSTKWSLVIPIDNTMNFGYINNVFPYQTVLPQQLYYNIDLSGRIAQTEITSNPTEPIPKSTILSAPP
jgi:hypothetical protein